MLAVEAMGLHFDLWQRYFDDFLLHKLRLGGLQGGAISQQILRAFFEQLHQQETLKRVVSLHCYIHVYHLDLAKMANLLRPLNQIQQVRANVCVVTVWPSGSNPTSYEWRTLFWPPKNSKLRTWLGKGCGLCPNLTEIQA